jgi:hypothetical protein
MEQAALAVRAQDEALHVPTGDPLWSESFYLNFSDGAGMLAGFTRLALHPRRKQAEGLLCLHLPRGKIGITHWLDLIELPSNGAVRTRALVHECLEPLRRWRIRYEGDLVVFDDAAQIPASVDSGAPTAVTERVTVDLEIAGLHAPFYYPAYQKVKAGPPHLERSPVSFGRKLRRALHRPREIVSALNARSGRHYEQSMQVRGSITIGGERLPFDGTGHRDHSWGPRDWSAAHRWRWLCGQMDGFAFNAMYLTIAGTHVTNGYVWCDGRCTPLQALELESTFDRTGLAGRDIRLRLTAAGVRYDIEGEVLANVPLPIAGRGFSSMYNVGRARYRYATHTGYGAAEFLERLDP